MDNYVIHYKYILGKGTFGKVYLAQDRYNKKLVAVKVEDKTRNSLLKKEYGFIRFLQEQEETSTGKDHIIKHLLFLEDNRHYYMFTDLYGPNIDYLHRRCGRKFSVNTTVKIAKQMLDSIRYCHEQGIVHRDIKPANFMVAFCKPHTKIYLGDYGLSKKYIINDKHIPCQTEVSRVGSMRYMSKYTHRGIQASCRDDIYSLAYAIIFMPTGWLPWSDDLVEGKEKNQRHNALYVMKSKTPNTDITSKIPNDKLKNLMTDCLDYLDTLEFAYNVKYEFLSQQLEQFEVTADWDWNNDK